MTGDRCARRRFTHGLKSVASTVPMAIGLCLIPSLWAARPATPPDPDMQHVYRNDMATSRGLHPLASRSTGAGCMDETGQPISDSAECGRLAKPPFGMDGLAETTRKSALRYAGNTRSMR